VEAASRAPGHDGGTVIAAELVNGFKFGVHDFPHHYALRAYFFGFFMPKNHTQVTKKPCYAELPGEILPDIPKVHSPRK
jgi:hypothetical protein